MLCSYKATKSNSDVWELKNSALSKKNLKSPILSQSMFTCSKSMIETQQ